MRKNRSNRRSHRRHHSKTMKRRHRGGNANMASSLYTPAAAVAREPALLADKVGQNVSDTLKKAQVSLLRGQYKAKEQTRKATDAVKGFGERISGAFKSLFGGSRKHRRHIKRRRSAKRH
jgi:hypothetical protein